MSTVIFDIDGVILDFNAGFLKWLKDTYNITLPPNPATYEWTGSMKDLHDKVIEFVRTAEEHLDPISEAICKLPGLLRAQGFKIVMITAYENEEARIKNLAEFGVEYDEIRFAKGDKKDKRMHLHELEAQGDTILCCVEDRPKTIMQYVESNYNVCVPSMWRYTQGLNNDKVIYYSGANDLKKYIHLLDRSSKGLGITKAKRRRIEQTET